VDHLFCQAKDEIKGLREKLLLRQGDGKIDIGVIEEALLKTEETLKVHE
jgi:hypothetical protein